MNCFRNQHLCFGWDKSSHFIGIMALILCLVFSPLTNNKACAQRTNYIQTGRIFLYQGRYNTVPFTQLASLTFGNAPTTRSDNKGLFTIDCQLLKPGQNLGPCKIETRQPYLLFNEREVNNWVLPAVKQDLEVLLCTQSYLNRIENAYINTQEAQLKKQIKQQKEELVKAYEKVQSLTSYNYELDKELKSLDEKYKVELENIKKRATLFAYVDERKIDSLEYAFRQCVLNGDMELAMRLGQQLTNDSLIESRIENAKTAVDKAVLEVQKLKNLTSIQETYLEVCRLSLGNEYGYFEGEQQCYDNLIRLYEELINLHGPDKMYCDPKTMKEWKRRLGYIYYYRYMHSDHGDIDNYRSRAVELGYPDALFDEYNDEEDYGKAKDLILRCVEENKDWGNDLFYQFDKDYLQDICESFPDFYDVQKGDTLYYHILNDKEVSLVFYVHGNKKSTEAVVPERVKHDKNSYKVTKIGMNAFGELKYWGCSETWVSCLGLFKENSPFPPMKKWDIESDYLGTDSLTKIKLPNSITYIGHGAFMNLLEKPLVVNIPKNIKTIKRFAFFGCKCDDIIKIPEGAISISVAWCGDSIRLELPSTLEELEDFDDHTCISREYMTFSDIKVHPDNPYLMAVDSVVFKKDGTKIYPLSMLRTGGWSEPKEGVNLNLFIPKNLNIEKDVWYDINAFLLPNSLSIEDGCENYSLYQGVLYNHAQDTLILRPKNVDCVTLPPTFRSYLSIYNFVGIKYLHVPREIPPAVFWDVLADIIDEDCEIIYDAIDEPEVLEECIQLAMMEDSTSSHSIQILLSILKRIGDVEHANVIQKIQEEKQLPDSER